MGILGLTPCFFLCAKGWKGEGVGGIPRVVVVVGLGRGTLECGWRGGDPRMGGGIPRIWDAPF